VSLSGAEVENAQPAGEAGFAEDLEAELHLEVERAVIGFD
jgi:hypothetical protein